jgi:type I restriction enzyme R subunit
MPLFSEKSVVEDYLIQKLQEKGWNFTSADNLERESFEEPLLTPVLIRALKRLNASINIGDEEIKQALNELKLKTAGAEHAKQILNYLKHGILIKFEKERVTKYVKLFDYDNPANNDFIVSRQVIHQSGDKQIRNDIILYVNGIPLVNIECKNPTSLTENWHNAFTQIKDYALTIREPYKYIQIGIAAEQTAKYFPIVTWPQEETKIHQWRTQDKKDPLDAQMEMLAPPMLLNIIRNYIFFRIEYGTTTKVITRYMQYRAAEKIYNRVIDYLTGKGNKNKGLIWHWQGSGKTLTMIFAANKLFHDPTLANPTILFTVDREDLQEQLRNEYNALNIQPKLETTSTINELKRILTHDEGKGKRGIFISLIQKWQPEEFQQLQKELEKISQTKETILNRKNVILFIDEGHRTQYGTLAGQMKLILKNASKFAFTGTPIAIGIRNTYQEFSYPPEDPYLDKYFIDASIKDEFTAPIAYQPRLEKDTRIPLPTKMLDTFFKIELEEIPEEYREPVEEKTKRKLNRIKMFLENPTRIAIVAKDIHQDFKENVDGKFKAIIVAASRKACVLYKRELDKLMPPEYSEIVMTFNRTDKPPIPEYLKEMTKRFNGKEPKDIRKDIIEKYKEQTLPKILIVTDMLLTGFDAPILQTMYLDKPLKEHRLLQAAARTNRPYKDLKQAGLILDYVGILKEFHKAFENYAQEDIKDILIPIDDLRKEFTKILEQTLQLFQNISRNQYDRQTMLQAIGTITQNEQKTKAFTQNYRRLRRLFEYLGTDPTKIKHFHDYKWLTGIYIYYTRIVNPPDPTEAKYAQTYFNKTLNFVHKTTELEEIQKQMPIITFDENYLHNLEEKLKSKEEKAANIVFTLNRFILVEKERSPIYESLAERVKKLLKLWKERMENCDLILAEGTKIIEELNKLADRQKQLGFSTLQYGILLTLEEKFGTDQNLTQDVKQLTNTIKPFMFKNWQTQLTARKNIEREIRKYLRKYIKQHKLTFPQLEELHQKIMQGVKSYAQV